MKYLLLLLPIGLLANILVVTTEDYLGRITITKHDYIIVNSKHSLGKYAKHYNVITCDTEVCTTTNIARLKRKWRTRGIAVLSIK